MSVHIVNQNIKEELLQQLKSAEFFIFAAVAWFTDRDILTVLENKASEGVRVEVILHDDGLDKNSINFSSKSLNFFNLIFNGGSVFLLNGHHNKYCVIDMKTYISGSYNWTHGASLKEDGFESIDIHSDPAIAFEKAKDFKALRKKSRFYYSIYTNDMLYKILGIDDRTPRIIAVIKELDGNIMRMKTSLGEYLYASNTSFEKGLVVSDEKDGALLISNKFSFETFQGLKWIVLKEKL